MVSFNFLETFQTLGLIRKSVTVTVENLKGMIMSKTKRVGRKGFDSWKRKKLHTISKFFLNRKLMLKCMLNVTDTLNV